ncbi:hypothetical protein EON64_05435 [archaeon]|nr:MAG: hypothetical protein EON64_05435 [archaeon]
MQALAFWFANNYLDATKEQEKNFSVDENASALKAVSGNQDEYITYLEEDWQALVDVVKLLSSASLKVSG